MSVETTVYTALVIVLSVAVALYLGLFDFIFSKGLAGIVSKTPAPASGIQIQQATSTAAPVFSTSTQQ